MTSKDIAGHFYEIIQYGVMTEYQLIETIKFHEQIEICHINGNFEEETICEEKVHATSLLYWLFYSQQTPGWEVVRTAIVQLTSENNK